MNIFNFTGNLGKDSEVKQTAKSSLCKFSVAVTSGYGDNKKTTWISCLLWGKRAEGALPGYLTKGAQVAITGELSLDEWEHEGKKYSQVSVNVSSLDLIGGKQEPRQQQPSTASQQQVQEANPQAQPAGFDDFDDDIPF